MHHTAGNGGFSRALHQKLMKNQHVLEIYHFCFVVVVVKSRAFTVDSTRTCNTAAELPPASVWPQSRLQSVSLRRSF